MRTGQWLVGSAVVLALAVGCGDDEGGGGGGGASTDGGTETGGASSGSGGRGSGGAAPAGGKGGKAAATGGAASSGGAAATGGAPATGGAASSGGGGGDPDAGAGGAEGGVPEGGNPPAPAPKIFALSPTGHDRLYGATFDAAGNLFAVGQLTSGIESASDYSIALVKILPSGDLDPSFGDGGIVTKNIVPGGTSREVLRSVVVQGDKLVVFGAVEHDPKAAGVFANDADLVLLRFDAATGALDESFGTKGVVKFDVNGGVETTNASGAATLTAGDTPWVIVPAPGDKLVIHASARAEGFKADGVTPRTDADWVLMRLDANGLPDPGFGGGDGKVTLDIAEGGASPRGVTVFPDGSIIGTGYTRTEVLGTSAQQPVLYKVKPDGTFDDTFATNDFFTAQPGVWHDYATVNDAEAYGAVVVGDKLVTMGYGPTPGAGAGTDIVSFRFTLNGDQDTTYGENGAAYVDVGGYGDNGRGIAALPGGRVLGIGAGRPEPAAPPPPDTDPEADALVVVLDGTGAPDTSFGPNGVRLYDMGGTGDHFWGVQVSPDEKRVAIVGIAGAEAGKDDDSALLVLPLE